MIAGLTLTEFAVIEKTKLYAICRKAGFKRSIQIRRELQVALAKAAQKGPTVLRLPEFVQQDLVQRIRWIEKACYLSFLYYTMKELYSQEPGMSRAGRKAEAKKRWEEYLRRESY